MTSLAKVMHQDHQHCDQLFATAEEALDQGQGGEQTQRFLKAMARHFLAEEELLFPAFEEFTGMKGMGPTQVMREEHQQMRGLLSQMQTALDQNNFKAAKRPLETLLILMQQHNLKEENILYPMMDMHLGGPELMGRLAQVLEG
ncbi:MAG: hypothetical protein A2600_04875 [Candidatus Lambdaproteobacteria bacterium RIFOXYD1_FULL_56_27]|uniref:Hemerythrin-like domain-containing protein n=1 Tax=Candidatus Lambdaproteobacteria bacterium RIFOXYD2_FULL_56_26 TaxID=1817773 RepID=A0A1F6H422_9PROT|nr:MAG: hypothetical protein A2426_13940 [Candidatus Lambdaproteobacteria bacterium RIFOXYC1_FULL_56_13]OGH05086.1 MAG: hypothetical protein A2557_08940 [Candidatus Lambdaproteobacteria bacterium RIFOXYD2_FULL_56_26]OGH09551.1 MAG: hypothetical protein A2600_04875 [Candidatus Lambdaproteobacteria bacterium RIFOXYD1_FULL_56_27]